MAGWPSVPERIMDGVRERRCRYCREWLPLDAEFWARVPGCRRGFASQCRACMNETRNASKQLRRALGHGVAS